MNRKFETEQENFWAGEFGEGYRQRNRGAAWVASNTVFFARVLSRGGVLPKSILELGANIGLNLQALRRLCPETELEAVEINAESAAMLSQQMPDVKVHVDSLLTWNPPRTYELVFTKGVLIHINPDELRKVYRLMYEASDRYVLMAEYYNPVPQTISYRGHDNRLFKRDFAGDFLDLFPEVRCVDYGFVWRRDAVCPDDDLTWFLLEKR